MAVCQRSEYFKDRFFSILDVVRGGEELRNFRAQLDQARDTAKARNDPAFRPRLICGGGDGTASFTLHIVFKALMMDTGASFAWTDEELGMYFPALVQMPLGTGNDLGGVLGWGRRYPGYTRNPFCSQAARMANLVQWFDEALCIATPVVNFDVWGFMPPPGEEIVDVKTCELAGLTRSGGKKQCVMKPAGVVAPFLILLYASYGFSAQILASFQLVRHDSQLLNVLEYFRIGPSLLLARPPAQLRSGMEGMTVQHSQGDPPEKNGTDRYFPPRATRKDRRYGEVGFLNINSAGGGGLTGADRASFAARWCRCGSGRKPVDYGDGQIDVFRMRWLRTVAKTGSKLQTDKRHGATFHFEAARGQGIFLQYDGEARFVFHPSGRAWRMDVRRVLTIPVVASSSSKPQAASDPVCFRMVGDLHEVAQVKARIVKWIRGELAQELNATADDIQKAGCLLQGGSAGAPKASAFGPQPSQAWTEPSQPGGLSESE